MSRLKEDLSLERLIKLRLTIISLDVFYKYIHEFLFNFKNK